MRDCNFRAILRRRPAAVVLAVLFAGAELLAGEAALAVNSRALKNKQFGRETTAIGTVQATIVAPVSAESASDLSFGTVVKNNSGEVTIDRSGNRTSKGPALTDNTHSAGSVMISGPRAQAVTVDIPEARIYNNADKSVDVHTFTTNKGKATVLGAKDGKATIGVGATLNIKDSKTQGGTRKGTYVIQTSY